VAMLGWGEVQREGGTVYVSLDGEEFDAIEDAHQAFQIADASGGSLRDVTKGLAQGKYRGSVLSQRDDWMDHGDHPTVQDMSLYVYSIWVHRVELPSYALPAGELGRRAGRRAAHPDADGFQFAVSAESSVETHCLMKSALLRPVRLPDADGPSDARELRFLLACEHLCVAPE
ncbi:unnamed protein product, partial [Prorocentrum cordatum]